VIFIVFVIVVRARGGAPLKDRFGAQIMNDKVGRL
jgi:hypothetical protein